MAEYLNNVLSKLTALNNSIGKHRKRLVLASIGAVITHLLFFSTGHLALTSFSIPSDTSRILMLTLDSSVQDGISEQEAAETETLNNVEVNKPSSIKQLPTPLDIEPSLTEIPDQLPTEVTEANEELKQNQQVVEQESLMELAEISLLTPIDSVTTPIEESITPVEETLNKASESSLLEESEISLADLTENLEPELANTSEANSEHNQETEIESIEAANIDETAIGLVQETAEPLDVLNTTESEIALKQVAATQKPQVETVNKVSVSKKQRKMLERKATQFAKQIESGATAQSVSWNFQGQTYVAHFKRTPAFDEMEMDKFEVEVVTEQDGQKLIKKMRMKKLAFSNFAQFVNHWDENVSIHDDELDGRFHSNSEILISPNRKATPLFFGKVTTASHKVEINAIGKHSYKKKMFIGGLETGVKKIRMPKPSLLYEDDLSNEGQNSFFYEQDTRITFTADGKYIAENLKAKDGADTTEEILIGDEPIYICSSRSAKLYVSGTVKGKVLLYSPKGIVIEKSLTYADKTESTTHENYLGLVSDKDIVVADGKVTGTGDLLIDASLYAKRQFRIKNYTSKHMGTLRIFGSLTAGSISATEPRYATNITFDKRLENIRPPNYPVSDRYELALSEHDWNVENGEQDNSEIDPTLQ